MGQLWLKPAFFGGAAVSILLAGLVGKFYAARFRL
jgi:hypothetical protein